MTVTDLCPACRHDIHVFRDETDPPRRTVYVAACDCIYSARDGYGSETEDEAVAKLIGIAERARHANPTRGQPFRERTDP